LLGADSLDKKVLQALLKKLGAKEEELKIVKEWGLFKLLVNNFCKADFAPLQTCFDARGADAHRIATITLPNEDLTFKVQSRLWRNTEDAQEHRVPSRELNLI
jgi:hypothetical protein